MVFISHQLFDGYLVPFMVGTSILPISLLHFGGIRFVSRTMMLGTFIFVLALYIKALENVSRQTPPMAISMMIASSLFVACQTLFNSNTRFSASGEMNIHSIGFYLITLHW